MILKARVAHSRPFRTNRAAAIAHGEAPPAEPGGLPIAHVRSNPSRMRGDAATRKSNLWPCRRGSARAEALAASGPAGRGAHRRPDGRSGGINDQGSPVEVNGETLARSVGAAALRAPPHDRRRGRTPKFASWRCHVFLISLAKSGFGSLAPLFSLEATWAGYRPLQN